MQYKKERTKKQIIESAINEFYNKGLDNASIRKIAEDADVAVGNIYNYFSSKQHLYDSIVNPVAQRINEFFEKMYDSDLSFKTIDKISCEIIPYIVDNNKQIRMLMNTQAESGKKSKEKYFDITAEKIKIEIDKFNESRGHAKVDEVYARAIGKSFLYGVFEILSGNIDSMKAHEQIKHFIIFFFKNLDKRI